MTRLTFKREFIDPILRGEKTSTIRGRRWARPGQRILAVNRPHDPPFAELEVTDVTRVPIEVVTELWPDVRKAYDQEHVFVIGFRRVSAKEARGEL